MLVLITYDVSTTDSAGQRRLRQVAKTCLNCGQRVQNSVFECIVDAAEWTSLRLRLLELIDPEQDSIRFYQLGNQYKNKIEHVGTKSSLDLEGPLIL
ncbi:MULTISPECIES: CRISPR-associated endonuclease Cas2 [Paenibacillus]|uniref:CRISPR-associated endoribonuclease Cas2 n=1 Tax=Paenibacillus brevis TaxID=2841508 RepID=A0ABS6FSR5_9BACL|nr:MULTISPECIES: CRISPR-associated endonuclease Cas2 [Paenibacillus]MBU5673284.1 CRISPR-associated endonuclease Cas2 [Paenibacillus brevis]